MEDFPMTYPIEDIKAGYLLVCHDNKDHKDYNVTVNYGKQDELACCCPGFVDFFPLKSLETDLSRTGCGVSMSVNEVYGRANNACMMDNSTDGRKLIWKRPVVKKMTLAQIEKELGYHVEIVTE